mmetsp:Transcript_40573/g.82888  ORF Transcript_40573/g.82888 Transcript_40573/m.82888 type:complete len:152 (-) Transcript_40573:84-539(-)
METALAGLDAQGLQLLTSGKVKELSHQLFLKQAPELLVRSRSCSSLRRAGEDLLRRKIEQILPERLAAETAALKTQISSEAAQRRRLFAELKLRAKHSAEQAQAATRPVPVRGATRFRSMDPPAKRPALATKRAVIRVDQSASDLQVYHMM